MNQEQLEGLAIGCEKTEGKFQVNFTHLLIKNLTNPLLIPTKKPFSEKNKIQKAHFAIQKRIFLSVIKPKKKKEKGSLKLVGDCEFSYHVICIIVLVGVSFNFCPSVHKQLVLIMSSKLVKTDYTKLLVCTSTVALSNAPPIYPRYPTLHQWWEKSLQRSVT